MLGIIIAMETETHNLIKKCFKDVFVQTIQNKKFYIIKTKNDQTAIISFSSIGKVNAAITTSLMVNNFNVKRIVNIGTCGIYENLNVNDILLIDKTLYGDVDVTAFNYEINQIPKMPLMYDLDNKFNEWFKKNLLIPNFDIKLGICQTTDSFINNKNYKNFHLINSNLPVVIDMECCAIAQVCYNLKIDFNAIKIGVDKLFQPINNQEQFQNNLAMIAKKIDMIVMNVIDMYSYYFNK